MPTPPANNADAILESVRSKLAVALATLKHTWTAYARRDLNRQANDSYPCVYCVSLTEQVLEEESDNRQLVAYPVAVVLLFMEAIVERTDPGLVSLRRLCQQAVYTTQHNAINVPPVPVEWVTIQESCGLPLPGLEDGITATAFGVTIGVLEQRTTAESYP